MAAGRRGAAAPGHDAALDLPDPRVDALRGCVAIERGPLVYCLEQADQPARLDELAVVPGAPLTEHEVTLPGIGGTIQVVAPGRHAPQGPAAALATAPAMSAPPATPGPDDLAVTAIAIPYFQWDNRGPGAMRVWIPAAPDIAGPV